MWLRRVVGHVSTRVAPDQCLLDQESRNRVFSYKDHHVQNGKHLPQPQSCIVSHVAHRLVVCCLPGLLPAEAMLSRHCKPQRRYASALCCCCCCLSRALGPALRPALKGRRRCAAAVPPLATPPAPAPAPLPSSGEGCRAAAPPPRTGLPLGLATGPPPNMPRDGLPLSPAPAAARATPPPAAKPPEAARAIAGLFGPLAAAPAVPLVAPAPRRTFSCCPAFAGEPPVPAPVPAVLPIPALPGRPDTDTPLTPAPILPASASTLIPRP